MPVKQQFFYDKQIRRYIQQFIRLFSGFSVQMGHSDDKLPIFHSVPVRYGDINRMAAHIQRENSENMTNTVPFISCYVNNVDMAPERRQYQGNVEKVQVFEKKYDESSQEYLNEVGNRYTIERHQPVPYFMDMNCDIWTSNTDQKLQLLEQIMVLFNPTLNIRTTNNPFDWTSLSYVENLAKMMFQRPNKEYVQNKTVVSALNKLLILHADHEQNCSTSTVRIVGSSYAGLFASISAGISALWGRLHGGANQAVIEMLEAIGKDGGDTKKYMSKAKDKSDPFRLMGFGHRVYKNFDPRAKIIKVAADEVLKDLGIDDPILDIAKGLEKEALEDQYFVDRKLYPNVDFYSGIIYKALEIPNEMFTVMFALGRLPGWVAHWREMRLRKEPIGRPRQVYIGENLRTFTDIKSR